MNLLGRKKDNPPPQVAASAGQPIAADDAKATAPKGKPTPKRNEAARKRGPVAPAPMTSAEARKRRKELRERKLTKAERKAEKASARRHRADARARMMAGEEAYLLPRDKGPVRRYVRDLIDSRRTVLGLSMPIAICIILVTLSTPSPEVQRPMAFAMPALILVMTLGGLVVGRQINRKVDEKFPNNDESGWKLGVYAAGRASQPRRMRTPRPNVSPGDDV